MMMIMGVLQFINKRRRRYKKKKENQPDILFFGFNSIYYFFGFGWIF